MAKNRALMERWRKWKIKKRRTSLKSFSSKTRGVVHRSAMKDAGVNAYGHRARSFLGLPTESNKALLAYLFNLNNDVIRRVDDPFLMKEIKLERLRQEDASFRVLDFNRVYLEGNAETEVSLSFFLGGLEMFFVKKKVSLVQRTIVYTDIDRAWRLYHEGRLKWLPAQIIPSPTSVDFPSPDG